MTRLLYQFLAFCKNSRDPLVSYSKTKNKLFQPTFEGTLNLLLPSCTPLSLLRASLKECLVSGPGIDQDSSFSTISSSSPSGVSLE
ncbi:hypothetical protein NC651_018891 [Populus alba x Populus x berolinensis]|nr:hypothetical protein NC651_018891 [Populus alba x Populus x berolinensis]